MKRASFITLTIIGAYSALQAAWRLIIHYRPKAAVLLVRIGAGVLCPVPQVNLSNT